MISFYLIYVLIHWDLKLRSVVLSFKKEVLLHFTGVSENYIRILILIPSKYSEVIFSCVLYR